MNILNFVGDFKIGRKLIANQEDCGITERLTEMNNQDNYGGLFAVGIGMMSRPIKFVSNGYRLSMKLVLRLKKSTSDWDN